MNHPNIYRAVLAAAVAPLLLGGVPGEVPGGSTDQGDRGGSETWTNPLVSGFSTGIAAAPLETRRMLEDHRTLEAAVTDAYTTLLGRAPERDELAYWSARARDGRARIELTAALARDGVALRTVMRLYEQALGRTPQVEEIRYWTSLGTAGAGVGILASPEARARGGDTAGYVAMLYRTVLGRESDPQGLAHWAGRLEQSSSPWREIAALWATDEARGRRIADAYRLVLRREPDPEGLLHWTSAGLDEPAASAFLGASDEFWRTAVPTTLPFRFARALTANTIHGPGSVTFVVVFNDRLEEQDFCSRVEAALTEGGAHLESRCSPGRLLVTGTYRGETLLLAGVDRRSFTLRIGAGG